MGATSETPAHLLNLHARLPYSLANGPGLRAVVWLQGCNRRCPGCFNSEAQPLTPRLVCSPQELWGWLRSLTGIEGVTVSGGEPLLQAPALLSFLRLVRREGKLSVILYTGYQREEVDSLPGVRGALDCVDVLVDGPYDRERPARDGWRGSTNQRLHFLTDRYTRADFSGANRAEVIVAADGTVLRTGVAPSPRSAPHGPVRTE